MGNSRRREPRVKEHEQRRLELRLEREHAAILAERERQTCAGCGKRWGCDCWDRGVDAWTDTLDP